MESLNNWGWFPDWLMRNISRGADLVVLSFVGMGLLLFEATRNGVRSIVTGAFAIPALIAILGAFVCFFSAPDARYAYGYVYSLGLLLLTQGVLSLRSTLITPQTSIGNGNSKVLTSLVVSALIAMFLFRRDTLSALALMAGSIFALLSATSLRANQASFWILCLALLLSGNVAEQACKVRDWHAWGHFPSVTVKEKVTHQGFIVREPVNTDQCWNTQVPCSPRAPEDLMADIPEPGRYRMFWIPKN